MKTKFVIQKLGLLIAMLLAVFPAFAYDFEVGGIYYNINSDPYNGKGSVWVTSNPDKLYSGDIAIPNTVQKGGYTYKVIGTSANAFKDCVGLSSVKFLFDDDIEIGANSFSGCSNLKNVELPSNLTGIPMGAFKNCIYLDFIELPSTIRIIESEAFANCIRLKTVIIPEAIQILGLKAFDNCNSLQNVFFISLKKPYCEGDSEQQVFSNCNAATSLWVPDKNLYQFGKEYISFERNEFQYSGSNPIINVINNLSSYQYSINWSNIEKDSGQYETSIGIEYTGEIKFRVNIPYSYTITKAPLIVKVNNAERQYGQENPIFMLKYDGLKNSENASVLWQLPEISTEATKASEVGSYPINVKGGAAKNYEFVAYYSGTLSITPAPLVLKVIDTQRMYGEDNPEFSFILEGLRNNDTSSCISTPPAYACSALLTSNCGEYEITASRATAKNYDISYKSGKLTITKAPLALVASNISREYGDSNPILKFTANGLKVDDTASSALNEDPIILTKANETSHVGEYEIIISGGSSKNYSLSYRNGILTVTKAPLTVIAEDAERLYGDNNPTFFCSYLGFKLSDNESTAFTSLPQITCEASKTSDVGKYPIAVRGGMTRNYEIISYENGVLTVTKAPLTLVATDKSRLYFEDNPSFDYTLVGLRNLDTNSCLSTHPAFKCTAVKTSNAGEYEIEPLNATALNYTIDYQKGILSINKRALTASISNYSKVYGSDNPQFEIDYIGFVNNEDRSVLTNAPNIVCLANQLSDVGSYPISLEGGDALNYIITKYNSGLLTIEKADQILTWEQDLSNIQMYSQVALEANSSVGLPVSYEMSPNNVATLYSNNGTWYLDCFGSGAVNIRAVQNGDKNHNAAPMKSKTLIVSGVGGDPSNPQIFLNVEEAGTLPLLIAENRKYQIKNLRLTGYLNGTDVNFLREMAGCDSNGNITVGILETLDISGCTIVSGGRIYYRTCYTDNFKVSDYMFYNCKVLVNLMLPDNTISIEDFAFADCDRLSVISIPNQVKSFGNQSFRNDISLHRIPMPQSLTSIGDMAFMGCNGISDITLPLNVKTIGSGMVEDCKNISYINVENGNSNFASQDGVLYTYSFDELLIFPANHNSMNCVVNDGTQRIASDAFVNAKNLCTVILPSSLLSIGRDAFIGCVNLSIITVDALTPPICENDCFEKVSKARCELRVPKGCYSYYWVAPIWSEFNKIVEVTGIILSADNMSLLVGQTEKLTATVQPDNTTDKTITWKSDNEAVATVSSDGTVTAVSVGIANITATCGKATATCKVTVNPVEATGVILSADNMSLLVGQSEKLTATVEPDNTTDKTITWKSDNEAVATVSSDGTVTAVSVGTANITAICGKATATCKVTVNPILIESITISPEFISEKEGQRIQLTVTILPEDATDKSLEWSSSDESVASVSQSGIVQIHKIGYARITATAKDGSGVYGTCDVEGQSEIESILINNDVKWDLYDMQGILVKSELSKNDIRHILPGFYILRSGNKVLKVKL